MSLKRIGKVVNTFGITGALKVISTSNKTEERFKTKNKVVIDNKEYVISSFSFKNTSCIILHLSGLDTINACQSLVGKGIWQEITLNDGEFFIDDVINMKVINSSGKELGIISDYKEINNMFYFIVNEKLIPYIKEKFVKQIDFDNKIVYVTELGEETLL